MNKHVIVTIMTGFDPSYRFARKCLRQYAQKIGADLKIIDSPKNKIPGLNPFNFSKVAWAQKFLLNTYLKDYSRVLYMDADIIIHPDAPDIFETYSDREKVYMFNEGSIENRTKEYSDIGSLLGNIDVPKVDEKKVYFNAGVILFSKESDFLKFGDMKEVAKICNKINFYEQTYFNYLIFKNKMNYGFLDVNFNRMLISGPADNRFEASFIHHAGGSYSSRSKFRFLTMIKDYTRLYSYKLTLNDYVYMIAVGTMFYLRRYTKKFLT